MKHSLMNQRRRTLRRLGKTLKNFDNVQLLWAVMKSGFLLLLCAVILLSFSVMAK